MPPLPQPGPNPAKAALGDDMAAIDTTVLDHLIDMIGPAATPEFIMRLLADLRRADAGISVAQQSGDPEGLRRHSHVLIGLAGAVGAVRLVPLAQHLNRTAGADAGAGTAALVAAAREQIALLIAGVMARNPAAAFLP